ncbi:MAG: hypothetical protein K0S65_687 [Labilithrix sp.]|nr:hypothetical protein [Labilithrix sp.]
MRSALVVGSCLVGLVIACGSGGESTFKNGGDGASSSGTSGSSGFSSSGAPGDDAGSSSGTSGGPSCATAEAIAAREPVYLDIILDGSRSMDGHGSTSAGCDSAYSHGNASTCFVANAREPDSLAPNRSLKVCHAEGDNVNQCSSYRGLTGKKWLAVRGALLAFFDAAKAKADPRFGLGMYLFGSEIPKAANAWDVQPGFVDDAQLAKLRARISPDNFPTASGTPLKGSINGQAPLLRDFVPVAPLEAGGKRVLVVVTDGAATDCSSAPACPDIVNAVTQLKDAATSITTFVIGVGDPAATSDSVYSETFLSNLANAGGAAPAGCNAAWDGQNPTGTPCHFQVTPGAKSAAQIQAEMSAAFDSIAAKVQSCELTLSKTSPIDPVKVNVVFADGAGKESQVAKDDANGWSYDNETDPSKVILNGSACAALKADPSAKVTIVIGCPTGTEVR